MQHSHRVSIALTARRHVRDSFKNIKIDADEADNPKDLIDTCHLHAFQWLSTHYMISGIVSLVID